MWDFDLSLRRKKCIRVAPVLWIGKKNCLGEVCWSIIMKRHIPWLLLSLFVVVGASLKYTPSASSSSSNQQITIARAVAKISNLVPPFTTTFVVDRTDDTAAATACTLAGNDCSLRGAIIAANAAAGATPVIINLASGTTYN